MKILPSNSFECINLNVEERCSSEDGVRVQVLGYESQPKMHFYKSRLGKVICSPDRSSVDACRCPVSSSAIIPLPPRAEFRLFSTFPDVSFRSSAASGASPASQSHQAPSLTAILTKAPHTLTALSYPYAGTRLPSLHVADLAGTSQPTTTTEILRRVHQGQAQMRRRISVVHAVLPAGDSM